MFAIIRPLRHDPDNSKPPQGEVGISPWLAADRDTLPNHFKNSFYLTTRAVFRKYPEWDDVLRLNHNGQVVDGGSSTPLWYDGKILCAPPLALGGLESITRKKIIQICRRLKIKAIEKAWKPKDAVEKGELLLVGSGVGVMSVFRLQGRKLKTSGVLASKLWDYYRKKVLKSV
jgi:branched-subunit amino acid aminotransferase/4-amino-4-deoxychorismate lyase